MKPTPFALAAAIVYFLITLSTLPAYAAKAPRPLLTDHRIKQVAYDPNQVYELVGTYGYQTTIEFAQDEQIKVRTLGDSIAWQTVINGSRLFVKPVEPNAATNMTIITNKRTYFFKLNSTAKQRDLTFLVRFLYPTTNMMDGASGAQNVGNAHMAKGFDPATLNLHYAAAGDKQAIQLQRAFDDGEFTYFQFDKNSDIPSFYIVGSDGTESVVNARREGAYMVVERTGRLFTLHNGDAHLCVENTGSKKDAFKTMAMTERGH